MRPFRVVYDVISLLNQFFDLAQLREAVFEQVESGQVGVIFLSQVDSHIFDEVIGHDIAVVLTLGRSFSQLTLKNLIIFVNIQNQFVDFLSYIHKSRVFGQRFSSQPFVLVKLKAASKEIGSGWRQNSHMFLRQIVPLIQNSIFDFVLSSIHKIVLLEKDVMNQKTISPYVNLRPIGLLPEQFRRHEDGSANNILINLFLDCKSEIP